MELDGKELDGKELDEKELDTKELEVLEAERIRLEKRFESAKNSRYDDEYDYGTGDTMRNFIELCFDLEAVYKKLGLTEEEAKVRGYRESTTKFYDELMYRTYG